MGWWSTPDFDFEAPRSLQVAFFDRTATRSRVGSKESICGALWRSPVRGWPGRRGRWRVIFRSNLPKSQGFLVKAALGGLAGRGFGRSSVGGPGVEGIRFDSTWGTWVGRGRGAWRGKREGSVGGEGQGLGLCGGFRDAASVWVCACVD